jgi:outer membrane protein OmpA-like peptidoglycan-associated protein
LFGVTDLVVLNLAVVPRLRTTQHQEGGGHPALADHPTQAPQVAGITPPTRGVVYPLAARPDVSVIAQNLPTVAEDLHFLSGSPRLTRSDVDILGRVIDVMKREPGRRIALHGHADDSGPPQRNEALARGRASAAAAWVRQHGIAAARIQVVSFGARQPLDKSGTSEARARNRRVEFVWQ